jgi:D-alanyl-D-alanine carboxypeptidase
MEINELQALAATTRWKREAGIALLLSSLVLALFLFIPLAPEKTSQAAAAVVSAAPDAYASVPLEAKAAIVYDLTNGQVLYSKNSDAQLPLASLTKLLTVYTALSVLGPDAIVTIPPEATLVDPPHSFEAGEQFTLIDLARITLTGSLNDGATALAAAASAQMHTTSPALLGQTAAKLGLSATYALNGSGLDLSGSVSGGYGSPHDVAILAGALASEAPTIALATTGDTAQATSKAGKVHEVNNTNPGTAEAPRLLLSKTGYTDLAGGNLAIVFDAGIGHPIAVVVLGSSELGRFADANVLIAATLAHFAGVASL